MSHVYGILSTRATVIEIDPVYKLPLDIAYDFAYTDARDLMDAKNTKEQLLLSNARVSTLLTIETGDIFWQGVIALDRTQYRHGQQKNIDRQLWLAMFNVGLPCTVLTEQGVIMHGALTPFSEAGTEGVIWTVREYGKTGYDALHCLENGDSIAIYSAVRTGKVDWAGTVQFSSPHTNAIRLDGSQGFHTHIIRNALHMDSLDWLALSHQKRPCIIKI